MPARAIRSIFFTRFHHEKGSRVLHQVPEGSITPSSSPSALTAPLFDFDSITTYLIPTQQFCDRLLTFCTNHYRVIGYPVCIREGRYSRNEFIFNFALVIEEGVRDWVAYGEVVRKLGRLLRGLEEQGGFVSREEDEGLVWSSDTGSDSYGSGSKVYALCEMVLEDLNNYAECMIPIDDSNTINLKLFPTHPPPPPVHPYHVPLLTISLASLTSPLSSDLTLLRILPFINGINSISHIAQLADTDISLTRKAIQHLVYYGCLVLLDIFSFSAVYAPSAEIGGFIAEKGVIEECRRYVCVPRVRFSSKSLKLGSESSASGQHHRDRDSISSDTTQLSQHNMLGTPDMESFGPQPPRSSNSDDSDSGSEILDDDLITLYTSLRQGLTLKNWVLENLALLHNIDIRRLITFGVIKGFLYRVHKYAISTAASTHSSSLPPAPPTSLTSQPTSSDGTHNPSGHRESEPSTVRLSHHHPSISHSIQGPFVAASAATNANANGNNGAPQTQHKPSIASTISVNPHDQHNNNHRGEELTKLQNMATLEERERADGGGGLPLIRFLDGMHSFDEICTELEMSERRVEEKIKGAGDVLFVMK